jgi:four helix bundle protein
VPNDQGITRLAWFVNAGTALAVVRDVQAKNITTLDAWRLSHDLELLIAPLMERLPLLSDRTLREQLKEAAAASPRHIEEGRRRACEVEHAQFLTFALGTLAETRHHLLAARVRGYITEDERQCGDQLARRAIGATCAWRRSLLRP